MLEAASAHGAAITSPIRGPSSLYSWLAYFGHGVIWR